jgi:hypothetical protein
VGDRGNQLTGKMGRNRCFAVPVVSLARRFISYTGSSMPIYRWVFFHWDLLQGPSSPN